MIPLVSGGSRMLGDIFDLEASLSDENRHGASLIALRERLSKLAQRASAEEGSAERSQARRVLRAITMGAVGRVDDREYRALLEQYGLRGR
jgi:hypothetical protein